MFFVHDTENLNTHIQYNSNIHEFLDLAAVLGHSLCTTHNCCRFCYSVSFDSCGTTE